MTKEQKLRYTVLQDRLKEIRDTSAQISNNIAVLNLLIAQQEEKRSVALSDMNNILPEYRVLKAMYIEAQTAEAATEK